MHGPRHVLDIKELIMDTALFYESALAFRDQGVHQEGQPICKQLGEQFCDAVNERLMGLKFVTHLASVFFGSRIIFADLGKYLWASSEQGTAAAQASGEQDAGPARASSRSSNHGASSSSSHG